MNKHGQSDGYGAFGGNPGLYGRTLHDLYMEIRRDSALGEMERQRLISQIEGVTRGTPPSTPIATLLARGLGGVVGLLIAKYFSMGPVGQAVVTAIGFGLGKRVYDQFNSPPAGITAPAGWVQLS